MNFDPRITLCALDGETTNKNDYRIPPLEPYTKFRWANDKEDAAHHKPVPPHEYHCIETMTKLRPTHYVPANLTWCRRDIIDPYEPVCNVSKEQLDPHKEDIIKTRPRVHFGTAVSIDDVPDPEIRTLLLNYMYTTDFKRTMKESQDYVRAMRTKHTLCENKAIPMPTANCPIRDATVHHEVPSAFPPLDARHRKSFESWDGKQMRATVDPTTQYWKRFYAARKAESDYDSQVPEAMVGRLSRLIESDRLRMPHDKIMGSYDGFVPQDMTLVDVEKVDLPMEHPMHTTNETVFYNHYDHANKFYEK